MAHQYRIPAVFMRGGTSKALMLKRADLPTDQQQWPAIFLAALGSPDPYARQLDGMGGGQSSLSKVCIIGPSSVEGADVDYTFAQISVTGTEVDYSGNCGNMSSAVGPFAYDEKMVAGPRDGECVVRIHNTNSGKIIVSRFSVEEGEACVNGGTRITGLASAGAPVTLSFEDPANTRGRGMLPAEAVVVDLPTAQGGSVQATLVDSAIPAVFVQAEVVGVSADIMPDAVDAHATLLADLEHLRQAASVRMGIAASMEEAARIIAIPKLCMVGKAQTYTALNGLEIAARDVDVMVRMISAGQPHRAAPITVSLATATAAAIAGSVVQQCLGDGVDLRAIRLGSPSGVVQVGVDSVQQEGAPTPKILSASIVRTQRRLMEGAVCVPTL
ncbi:MAG: PrpF domain-containing protein [Paenalcaligenes sp.]